MSSSGLQVVLIVIALLGSILAGISYLLLDSPFVPLIIGGVVLAVLSAPLWTRRPILIFIRRSANCFPAGGSLPEQYPV